MWLAKIVIMLPGDTVALTSGSDVLRTLATSGYLWDRQINQADQPGRTWNVVSIRFVVNSSRI